VLGCHCCKGQNLQCFKLTWRSLMNSVSVCLLSSFTCWCCAFIDLYLIGQGRVICDNDQLTSTLKDNKQELEFIKDHGSNNQLFLTLRKQITIIQKTDKKIHDMSSAITSLKVKQTHKIYDYPRDKFYSIQHRVDYRNNQSISRL
jgi:hypothetical protein